MQQIHMIKSNRFNCFRWPRTLFLKYFHSPMKLCVMLLWLASLGYSNVCTDPRSKSKKIIFHLRRTLNRLFLLVAQMLLNLIRSMVWWRYLNLSCLISCLSIQSSHVCNCNFGRAYCQTLTDLFSKWNMHICWKTLCLFFNAVTECSGDSLFRLSLAKQSGYGECCISGIIGLIWHVRLWLFVCRLSMPFWHAKAFSIQLLWQMLASAVNMEAPEVCLLIGICWVCRSLQTHLHHLCRTCSLISTNM